MGYYSNKREIKIQCDCSNWVEAETEVDKVRCGCGNVFLVTVTEMYDP